MNMKGDFSRLNGLKARRKHFNAVYKQQGRVQLDSDWNELVAIQAQQQQIRTIDTIGYAGVPVHDGGFDLFYPAGAGDLLIGAGRMYVGGLLCETTPAARLPVKGLSAGPNFDIQLDDLKIDGEKILVGDWVLLESKENPNGLPLKITSVLSASIRVQQNISAFSAHTKRTLRRLIPLSNQPDLPKFPLPTAYKPVDGKRDLVYLEVWERHITAIEDAGIREVALGGPDTDTRGKIVAQVKVLKGIGNLKCSDTIPEFEKLKMARNGRMSTFLENSIPPSTVCELGESGGFQGLENRLYRVEIHEFKNGKYYFKWSRDNGAYAYKIAKFNSGKNISLSQNGKDAFLQIKKLDWVEVFSDDTDLSDNPAGTIAQVMDVIGNDLILDTDIIAYQSHHNPKIRRWDTAVGENSSALKAITFNSKIDLEDGIQVEFSGTEFKTGDYWVFAARIFEGNFEILEKEAPMGIQRHYCRLGIFNAVASGGLTIEDCRPMFPPLTELPEDGDCCCALSIKPTPDWAAVFATFQPGQNINICFEPGEFLLDKPIELAKLGHITFQGAGQGSHVRIRGHETAFYFRNCGDVCIRDLAVSSEHSPQGAEAREEGNLNGALTILDCEDITLENVRLVCAASNSEYREATCVTIRTEINPELRTNQTTTVSIRHSECRVGAGQTGILVVNSDITHIESNRIRALSTKPDQVASQGITVAGIMGRNIRVIDNTIEGVFQGIHLGFSNKPLEENGEFFEAGAVHIDRNNILVLMLNLEHAEKERHGIFVGNSNSIMVGENFITLLSGKFRRQPRFIGINIVGHWGRRMIVRHNHLQGNFGKEGIVVNAIPALEAAPFWIVEGNVATVIADDPQIIQRDNV